MALGGPGGAGAAGPGEGGIGGVPGGIGAVGPGVAGIGVGADFGGLIGRGDRGLFSGKSGKPGVTTAAQLDALLAAIPFFGMGNLALSSLGMGLGQFAQGDPSSGGGVTGPEGGGGVGGGPAQTQTVRKIQTVLAAPVVPEAEPPGVDPDLQRRRVGRQDTILTGGALSEPTTLKPVLLGQ